MIQSSNQSKYSQQKLLNSGLTSYLTKSMLIPSKASAQQPSQFEEKLDDLSSEEEEEEEAATRNYFQNNKEQEEDDEEEQTRNYNQKPLESGAGTMNNLQSNDTTSLQDNHSQTQYGPHTSDSFQEYENDDVLMQNSKIIDIFTDQRLTNQLLESQLDDASLLSYIINICKQNGVPEIHELGKSQETKIYKTKISKVLKCQRADKSIKSLQYLPGMSAIKIIKISDTANQFEDLNKETTIWSELQKIHALYGTVATATLYSQQNIKNQQDATDDEKNKKTKMIIIYMEYLEKSLNAIMHDHEIWMNEKIQGTLEMQKYTSKNKMKHKFVPITPQIIIKIIKDLITSLFLMHLNGIFHMDIKSLNIMYHEIIDRFVFIDFGASDIINNNNVFSCEENCFKRTCTIEYCPEEMTMPDRGRLSTGENIINPYSVDIWSLGMVFLNLTLICFQANDAKNKIQSTRWQEEKYEFEELRRNMGKQYGEWRTGGLNRNHIEAFYSFVEKLTDQIFFNLNNHDVELDLENAQLRKGVNHLKAMLIRDHTQRITSQNLFLLEVFELALDLNLPVLQYLIHPPPLIFAKHESETRIIHANGSIYEGQIDKLSSKRVGLGCLSFNSHEIYKGEWENDFPIFKPQNNNQIQITLPHRIQNNKTQDLIVRLMKVKDHIMCVGLTFNSKEYSKSTIELKCNLFMIFMQDPENITWINAQFFLKELKGSNKKIYILQCDNINLMQNKNGIYSNLLYSQDISPNRKREISQKRESPNRIQKQQDKIYLQKDSLQELHEISLIQKDSQDNSKNMVVVFQSKVTEVLYSQKLIQNLLFGVSFKGNNKRLQIAREIQFCRYEDPYPFYDFLCEISYLFKMDGKDIDTQITHICNYLLFIIKSCNFIRSPDLRQIQYSLLTIMLPLSDVNDSELINIVSSFKEVSPKIIDLTQSQQITDVSIRYLLFNGNFTQLNSLILTGTSISDFILEDLTTMWSENLKNLETLDLSYCGVLTFYGLKQFFLAKIFLSLKYINLSYTSSQTEVFENIMLNSSFKNLITLELQGCPMNEKKIEAALNKIKNPMALNYLNLQATDLGYNFLKLISQLRRKQLHNLEKLNISCNGKINTILPLFGNDQNQVPYLIIDISWTNIDPEELIKIINSSLVNNSTRIIHKGLKRINNQVMQQILNKTNVKQLQIAFVVVEDQDLQPILNSNPKDLFTFTKIHIEQCFLPLGFYLQLFSIDLGQLEYINLTGTMINDDCLKEMTDNDTLTKLYHLILDKCTQLSDKAIQLICKSSFAQILLTLHMGFTNINDSSLVYLTQSSQLKHLENLSFRLCKNVTNDGAEALLRTKWLMSQLHTLDLSHNQVGFKTLRKALKVVPNFRSNKQRQLINLFCCPSLYKPIPPPVTYIDQDQATFGFTKITKQFLLSLSESPSFSILLPKLQFSFIHELTDPIFTQMLQSKYLTKVLEIDVSFTNIKAMSIRMLADNVLVQENIEELHLAGCQISDLALSRLMRKGFPKLRILDLSQTKISDTGLQNLQTMGTRLRKLVKLQLDFCDNITIKGITLFKANHNFTDLAEIFPHPHGNLL